MDNSSLVELLKTFSEQELRDFSEYLDSPYFNKGKYWKESQRLYEVLLGHAPSFDSPELERETVCLAVFPNLPFSDARLKKVMVKLAKSIREFLLHEDYHRPENEMTVDVDFAHILLKRKLGRRASSLAQATKAEIVEKPHPHAPDFFLLYRIALLQGQIEGQHNTWKKDLNIGETLIRLDQFFFSSRLDLLNHFLLLRKFAHVDSIINMERQRQLVQWLEAGPELPPSMSVAKKIFDLYTSSDLDQQAFATLLTDLDQLKGHMATEDLARFYTFLRDYCSNLVKSGRTEMSPVLLKIQRANLADGYFYTDNRIAPGAFMNIVLFSLKTDDPEWTLEFITAHRGRIIGDNDSQDYYRLAMASYLFRKEDFDRVLDFIPQVSANLDYHLSARRLELKTYYELGSDLLQYKIDSFKMYLSRNHEGLLSEETYRTNANFLNILVQLVQSAPGDRKRQQLLLRRIEEKSPIISKDWLVEKVKGLA